MKLGFLTACLPQLSLDDLVAWAAAQGFLTLELAAWPVDTTRNRKARQIDTANFNQPDADRVKEIFAKHNMSISANRAGAVEIGMVALSHARTRQDRLAKARIDTARTRL